MQAPAAAVPIAPGRTSPQGLAPVGRAIRRNWLAFGFVMAGVVIGTGWDRAYHATHPFDTFYSPPHLFIYTMAFLAMATVAWITFSPRLRPWFGPGFRLPVLPFQLPGSLGILGGGLALLALAGALDDLWHTNFGLDETGWSTPHAMLGWSLMVVAFGLMACRMALGRHRPMPWYTWMLFAYLALGFTASPLMGPLYGNNTPETVQGIASIPVLQGQPEAQHTFRIYLTWNLDRTNPIFIPLSALWAGVALAMAKPMVSRRGLVVVTIIFSLLTLFSDRGGAGYLDRYLDVSSDPASYLPLPIFPAAVALLILLRDPRTERWGWAVTGLLFGLITFLIWGRHPISPLLIPLAAPATVLGSRIGRWLHGLMLGPTKEGVLRFLPIAGLAMPLVVGMVDLYLRSVTP